MRIAVSDREGGLAVGGRRFAFIHTGMGLIPAEHREGMPEGWAEWLQHIRHRAESQAAKK